MTSLDCNGGQVQRDDDDHDVAQGDAGTTVVVVAGDGGELGGGENWTLLSLSLWVSAILFSGPSFVFWKGGQLLHNWVIRII